MKKIFLLLFLLIPFNVFALDFDYNNNTIEVTDVESLRDYCYFVYKVPMQNQLGTFNLVVTSKDTQYVCMFIQTSQTIPYVYRSYIYNLSGIPHVQYKFDTSFNFTGTDTNSDTFTTMNYTSTLINTLQGATYMEPNFTFADIEEKYSSLYPSNNGNTSSSSISKNDFYVLCILVAVIVFLSFFKVMFPNLSNRRL